MTDNPSNPQTLDLAPPPAPEPAPSPDLPPRIAGLDAKARRDIMGVAWVLDQLIAENSRLAKELADVESERQSLEDTLAKVDNAAHAHRKAQGRPLDFGFNFGEAALGIGGEFARLADDLSRIAAERDALLGACRAMLNAADAELGGPTTLRVGGLRTHPAIESMRRVVDGLPGAGLAGK